MTYARRPHRARLKIMALLLALLAVMMVVDAASAQPINGRERWCARFPQGGNLDCAYKTLQQCMAAASGVSNGCELNPWYGQQIPRPGPFWPFK